MSRAERRTARNRGSIGSLYEKSFMWASELVRKFCISFLHESCLFVGMFSVALIVDFRGVPVDSYSGKWVAKGVDAAFRERGRKNLPYESSRLVGNDSA